jgi:hypothetical protein
VQPRIGAAEGQQLRMAALLDDAALVEHDDMVASTMMSRR